MTEAVLDASVVMKWFREEGEEQAEAARSLRATFQAGGLRVVVPSLLYLEILNVAGRRWSWPRAALFDLAASLRDLRFDTREPGLLTVSEWTARGLTAYDAVYVALAESEGLALITSDERILSLAPRIATPLTFA